MADLKARLKKLTGDRKVLLKQAKAATDALAEVDTDIEATKVEIAKLTAVSATPKGQAEEGGGEVTGAGEGRRDGCF